MLSKPIVVCRNTGVDIIVEDNGIGLVVDYSKSGFESAINEFIGMDEYELFEMGQRARSLYDNRYSWCNMQEVLLGVYGVI